MVRISVKSIQVRYFSVDNPAEREAWTLRGVGSRVACCVERSRRGRGEECLQRERDRERERERERDREQEREIEKESARERARVGE